MESIAKKIVKYRILILIVATILLIPSGIGFIKTKVNYDILTSLPETANAIVGQNILGDDFGQKATAMVTDKGLPDKEVKKIADKIEDLDGVNSVIWIGKFTDTIPTEMIPSDIRSMIDNGDEITAKIVFDLAKENDYLANTVVDEVCFYLGLATANLSNALNPEYLVIGGGVSAAGEFLLKRVKQNFEKFAFPTVRTSTQLKLAELGNDAGVIGAASLARQFVNAD